MSYFTPSRRRTQRRLGGHGPIVAAIAFVLVVGLIILLMTSYLKDSPVTLTVTGKESVSTSEGHQYRILTEDEVYVMEDSIFKARFRTANDYARVKEGVTYTCTKFGWRIPFFSLFENIRDCKPVTP